MKKLSSIKKIISIVLAAVIVLSMSCSSSFALAQSGGAMVYTGAGNGTYYENPSEAWASLASLDEGVAFQLLGDWEADENGSFGEGVGFKDGAMYLKDKREGMIIDLNGYNIDRGLDESRENGFIFQFIGCMGVVMTNNHKMKNSQIRGGNNKNDGGAFDIGGTAISFNNIEFVDNTTEGRGGAFFIREANDTRTGHELSEVEFRNCVISGNNAAKTGGGIFINAKNFIWLFDTSVTGNYAKNDAGIHTEVSGVFSTHIHLGGKVVIADNFAQESGTGLMLDENFIGKVSITYVDDKPLSKESRITILSKTDDDTLRITADSSATNFECFEYENDSYKIVEKGSGDSQYLAIKKN